MKARTKTINGKKYYFPSTGKDFTTMLKKKQLEQEQRDQAEDLKQFIGETHDLTPENFGAELFDLTEKYGAKLQAYQIFGVMEIVKAKRFHDIGTHYDQVISGNLCDNKHPDAPHIRCTKKRSHSGLCGTGGPDDNEIMWDV